MNRSEEFSEVRTIADEICAGTVTQMQLKKLEILLANDEQARQFYLDYIEFHVHLKSSTIPDLEIVRRKTVIDEVVVRPTYVSKQLHEPPPCDTVSPKKKNKSKHMLYFAVFFTFLSLLLIYINTQGDPLADEHFVAELVSGRLLVDGNGNVYNDYVYPGMYKSEGPVELRLRSGDSLVFASHSHFKLFNITDVKLKGGEISVTSNSNKNITISTDVFDIEMDSGYLTVKIVDDTATVSTDTDAKIIPKAWRPRHFWNFDDAGDRVMDFAGTAVGVAGDGAKRIDGLIGKGAFYFDNGKDARINVGSGGGSVPATGSFSVIDGVTIEALIRPLYNGKGPTKGRYGEIDEIFRKDQSDKDHRMLLSFQNDRNKSIVVPAGNYAESISFGLYILGQGYHELKLPLDGKNGRPTLRQLKDGNFHHVVATYDVKSGLKAIYIDGKIGARFQYPPGSKVLSGGAGLANIGNSPNAQGHAAEAYAGTIDEVAFYDFSLPPFVINLHYKNVVMGLNYFGNQPSAEALPLKSYIELSPNKTLTLNNTTGLPERAGHNEPQK
ncbi:MULTISPECIES: LamG-like jellyroll fold domain-containing protein [unclassified Alteromonas]|uniref:LamG-like jellyroll fold domain-containing protein n=1 Tax=unclassified Alteromonas TaxID=2614992 RepID=UPI000509656B|nr:MULTISPECIES: LamG-like jellyroll fold domain-containing protein [unclassified Alteromonas]